MSVVLRCENCGTTKATPGECEACHQAPVRYFCTNHAPGLWLDSSTCPRCKARPAEPPSRRIPDRGPAFSDRTRPPAPVPAPTREATPAGTRAPAPTARPARRSVPVRAATSPEEAPPPPRFREDPPPGSLTAGWDSRERLSPGFEEELPPAVSGMALWQKLLAAAVRARSMSARAAPRPPQQTRAPHRGDRDGRLRGGRSRVLPARTRSHVRGLPRSSDKVRPGTSRRGRGCMRSRPDRSPHRARCLPSPRPAVP